MASRTTTGASPPAESGCSSPISTFPSARGRLIRARKGDSAPLDGNLFCISFSSSNPETRKLLGTVPANLVGLFKKAGWMKKLFGHRCVFPSVMVSMVGKKPAPAKGG